MHNYRLTTRLGRVSRDMRRDSYPTSRRSRGAMKSSRAVIAPAKLLFDYRRRSRGTFAAQFGRRPSLSKLFWPFGGLVRVLKGSRRRSNDLVDQVVGNFRPSESSFSLVAFCLPSCSARLHFRDRVVGIPTWSLGVICTSQFVDSGKR